MLECHIFLILVTQAETTISPARPSDSRSGLFVWNQSPRVGIEAFKKNKQKQKNKKDGITVVYTNQNFFEKKNKDELG